MFDQILNKCARESGKHMEQYYAAVDHCVKRPVLHCWHVVEGRDKPVCCWCEAEGNLPAVSGLIEENLFRRYVEIIERNGKNGVAAPINGLSMTVRGKPTPYGVLKESIEALDLKSGIRHLYVGAADYGVAHSQGAAGDHLERFGILKANMENLKAGKIGKKYQAEAIREIEAQAWYLPDTATTVQRNQHTKHVINSVRALKGQITRKQRTHPKHKDSTESKTSTRGAA